MELQDVVTESTLANRDDIERFKKLRQGVPPNKREHPRDLPRWVKTALVYWALDGMSYKDAAARLKRSPSTLAAYAHSPAAKQWLASLHEFLEDPVQMAKAILAANAHSITLERFAFLQAAIEAGDYKTGDAIARDLQDRVGIVAKRQQSEAPAVIKIQFGGSDLSAPVVDAEWESVEDE